MIGRRDINFFIYGAQGRFIPEDRFLAQQVDDSGKAILLPQGQSDNQRVSPQLVPQTLDRGPEVGPQAIHFINEGQLGHPVAIRLPPNRLRLRLHPIDGIKNPDGAVQDPERPLHLDGEIHMPRGIDDIDHAPLPMAGGHRRGDGDPPFLFLGHPVHHRGAVMHLSHLMGLAGVIKNAFSQGGLAGVDVGDDPDIPQVG